RHRDLLRLLRLRLPDLPRLRILRILRPWHPHFAHLHALPLLVLETEDVVAVAVGGDDDVDLRASALAHIADDLVDDFVDLVRTRAGGGHAAIAQYLPLLVLAGEAQQKAVAEADVVHPDRDPFGHRRLPQ